MSVEEAFQILGLSPDADVEDVKAVYRRLSKEHHPNKGGDTNAQSELNEARTVALDSIVGHKALVALDEMGRSIQEWQRAMLADRAGRQANDTARAIRRRRVRPLLQMKYFAWVVGLIAAAFALVSETLLPFLPAEVARLSLMFGLPFGLFGGAFQLMIRGFEHRLESFMEDLTDPRTCAFELARALDYRDTPLVLEDEIHAKSSSDMAVSSFPFSPKVSQIERRRLLILKSLEHGLLESLSAEKITLDAPVQYKLSFKPSRFRPPPEQQTAPTRAASKKEARFVILVGGTLFAIFAAPTLYLGVVQETLWSIAPGVFACFALLLLIGGCIEWITASFRE